MTQAEQNQHGFLRADVAALRSILRELSADNLATRLGLESRLRGVESELAAFDARRALSRDTDCEEIR